LFESDDGSFDTRAVRPHTQRSFLGEHFIVRQSFTII
jgi:hypothetical protein